MMDALDDFRMTDAEFRILSDLLRSRCGLHFDEATRYLAEKRLARRIRETDLGSVASYLYLLRNGASAEEELSTLIDILTTNETSFFRERSQLDALVEEAIPELLARPARLSRPISIWSAGCSTGEEPYSIVVLGREAGLVPGKDFRVYASDISRPVLAKARRGIYREAAFRETDDRLRASYFAEKDGHFKISDRIKREVHFVHMNFFDSARVALLGTMDIIMCRNVLIYFDLESKKQVVKVFRDKLEPGGYLFLGHAESLISVTTDFELKHFLRDLVYRRPVPGEEREDPWHSLAHRGLSEAERIGDDQ